MEILKKNICVLLIVAIFALSALATLSTIPKAKAICETVDVPAIDNFTPFQRVWCSWSDGVLGECSQSIKYPNTAHINGQAALMTQFGGQMHAELLRLVFFTDENGVTYSAQEGNMPLTLQTRDPEFTWGDYEYYSIDFYDNLCINPWTTSGEGLRWYAENTPDDFSHYKWSAQYEVTIWTTDAWGGIVDVAILWRGTVYHDERQATNTLYNYQLCPEDTDTYISNAYDYNTYGYAYVYSPANLQGSAPNNDYAGLSALGSGSVARIYGQANVWAFGHIYVDAQITSTQCRFLVYGSHDNSNWHLCSEQMLSGSSFHWIDCGAVQFDDRYFIFVAYNSGTQSSINIDAVHIGHAP